MYSYIIKEKSKRQEYCTYLACFWTQTLTLLELFEHLIKIFEGFLENNRVNGQKNNNEDREEQSTLRRTNTPSKKKKKRKKMEKNYVYK